MQANSKPSLAALPLRIFIKLGVLPFFLIAAVVIFTLAAPNFLSPQNLINVARQSVYLVLVSLGQMLVLISGGFDLSVGTVIALSSVVSALAMTWAAQIFPDAIWLVILIGAFAGFAVALIVGAVNGIGVALFDVSPFIMTLGVSSVGTGLALFLTGGVPVSGLPFAFGDTFGFGRVFGVPVPVVIAVIAIIVMWVLMARTRVGARIYAVGGNIKAAHLSAINTRGTLILVYGLCAVIAALTGLLLTARVESGDANLGGTIAMESIAACVIAGVSLRGGIGRVENVVLGAFFIILMQNGMNLAQVSSYMQMVLIGLLLICAVIFDQLRYRMIVKG
ncbi:ABC transporter permease [Thioclava sediminum]|uniref:ABC transporter permease n=3 Tax=Paracoccaceae TaxID=31989 RepID=A0ABX6YYZ1_9RHOB|nr:ABC transporter permease [Thioclava sp. JE_KL1]OOY10885.1 ABC transporter permease [Thioclava sp. F36-7]OOY22412.1 ABC transporter permease [Thioclava sp. DLFJ5-1]OOY26272.1 ABC transporter permease [Thioclava sediminum]OOY33628.1 ABC transporter permease [Thioclava sp. F36-6]QPZ93084.1 ABC transporter permease [Thioclava electrotropha]